MSDLIDLAGINIGQHDGCGWWPGACLSGVGGGWGSLPLWESVGMRCGFAPHFRHLDDLFAPLKFDHVYHFIQILLGPISKPPNFQHVEDLFAPKIDQIYNFIQILLGPILNFEPCTLTDFYTECPPLGFWPDSANYLINNDQCSSTRWLQIPWHQILMTGGWNPSSNKTRAYPFYIVNIMAAGVLATQGARTSAAMILT